MAKRDPWADAPAEMTAAEYLERLKQEKGGAKFGNVRTETDAGMADSKAEAERWAELRLMERAGLISDLKFHTRHPLPAGIVYEDDASYTEGGRRIVEDVKGCQTAAFRLKWRLMHETYPDVELRIVRR